MTQGQIVDEQGKINNFAIEPRMYVDAEGSRVGFTAHAERINGRLAMVGFVALIALESLTGQDLVSLLSSLM
ncbi:MAG TPA: chlorophyll a/b-binding protein [Leptolyngbyaceae cyanobacterium]